MPRVKHPPLFSPRTVILLAYDGCQSTDITGPWEVFTSATRLISDDGTAFGYKLILASLNGGEIRTNSGLSWASTVPLSAIETPVDTVLVVGGVYGTFKVGKDAAALVEWLRSAAPFVRRFGGLCTGTFALAAAGLLDGRRATTHWSLCEQLATAYPRVLVNSDANYIADNPVYCAAGISAAIDLSLALVETDLGGRIAALVAQDLMLYLRRPAGHSQRSTVLEAQMTATDRWREIVTWIFEHPAHDLRICTLAERMRMSERHFARHFKSETGKTPARYVEDVRLDYAKTFLERTSWPLARIAEKSGFGSVDSLQRTMRRKTSQTCESYRFRYSDEAK